jgi:uncharacterized protein YqgC (DUF456 family)
MALTDLVVGLAILVGLIGIVVPILPGSILILGAVLVWTLEESTATGWTVFAAATTLLVIGGIVKYAVPGRRLKAVGVPNRSLVAGGLLGIVGFFVIPVVGLVVGFVVGLYLSEWQRLGHAGAWPSTQSALGAVGLSMLIELAAGLLAAITWLVGAVLL